MNEFNSPHQSPDVKSLVTTHKDGGLRVHLEGSFTVNTLVDIANTIQRELIQTVTVKMPK